MTEQISAKQVRKWLSDGREIAFADVRENGRHGDGHPFFAVSMPYSVFEQRLVALVPNPAVRLVLFDDDDGIADLSAARAADLGYSQVFIMEQQAKETRAKARRRRLEDKIAAVDAELNPATLLEHQASPLITLDLPAVSVTRNDAPVPVVQDNDVIVEDRPRRFASDTELAAWAIANPENLSEKQRSVLLECLSNAADREVFRLSNIDLDRLRAIVRDAA